MNLILDTDSYKAAHYLTYPPKTTGMFSYLESRGGRFNNTIFFGLQYYLQKYLTTKITVEMVEEAKEFFAGHGEPFNYEGWMRIAKDLNGKIPIRIRAVPEGTLVPTGNLLMSVESTDPETFWVVSWFETLLLRVWYPISVATLSFHLRKLVTRYLDETAERPQEEILFKLHDFGSRGVSSQESASIGGVGHLINFRGTDTVAGIICAKDFYSHSMAGFSIPATEHSTMTMWGKDHEVQAFANVIDKYAQPGKAFACVSDSYDIYNAVKEVWGKQLKQKVLDSGATLVIRPDSGNPPDVVINCLKLLEETFGVSWNSKMYKVLHPQVRLIQGDGINEESIRQILESMKQNGYSASNITFGMGGKLLQDLNRDTQKFAFKCSWARINHEDVEVYKSPITDHAKDSKRGRLDLVSRNGTLQTVAGDENFGSVLKTVYENGEVKLTYTMEEIRERAWPKSGE